MNPVVVSELAPTGVLRAGINLSNFLLVSGKGPEGEPRGVAPDMAAEVARRLGVPVKLVPFKGPAELADKAGQGIWDIGLIGAEPQRAEKIAFAPAYVEIRSTYLVRGDSPIQAIDEVDRAGNRIVAKQGSAYGLWLERNIKNASLVMTETIDGSFEQFVADDLEVLAGLRPRLLQDAEKLPGARILDGQFSSVQQSIGTARPNAAGAAWLRDFVEDVKASGFVAGLIEKHQVQGLSVAPPA
ncbi:MAG: transporter substrate-binding domain-containing protein [Burkholderiaceae bacterium]